MDHKDGISSSTNVTSSIAAQSFIHRDSWVQNVPHTTWFSLRMYKCRDYGHTTAMPFATIVAAQQSCRSASRRDHVLICSSWMHSERIDNINLIVMSKLACASSLSSLVLQMRKPPTVLVLSHASQEGLHMSDFRLPVSGWAAPISDLLSLKRHSPCVSHTFHARYRYEKVQTIWSAGATVKDLLSSTTDEEMISSHCLRALEIVESWLSDTLQGRRIMESNALYVSTPQLFDLQYATHSRCKQKSSILHSFILFCMGSIEASDRMRRAAPITNERVALRFFSSLSTWRPDRIFRDDRTEQHRSRELQLNFLTWVQYCNHGRNQTFLQSSERWDQTSKDLLLGSWTNHNISRSNSEQSTCVIHVAFKVPVDSHFVSLNSTITEMRFCNASFTSSLVMIALRVMSTMWWIHFSSRV